MALAPEIASFGDGDHEEGETGLTASGGGFGAFPGRVLMCQNSDGSGLVDVLTVNGAWSDIEIAGIDIPASPNNAPGAVYLIIEREDLAWSQGFAFTLSEAGGSFTVAAYLGGTAANSDGVMGTDFLSDATPVPSTAVMRGGIAHSQAGLRYVASWPASGEVYYNGGRALREDGAMIIVTSGTTQGYYDGIAMTYRGETIVSTAAPQLRRSGFGLRSNGALCVSEAA